MRSGLFLLVAATLVSACAAQPMSKTVARGIPVPRVVETAVASDDAVTVNVLELFCQSCAEQIIAGCRAIPGVAAVDVDRHEKRLTLHYDSSFISRDRVLAAVDDVVASIP